MIVVGRPIFLCLEVNSAEKGEWGIGGEESACAGRWGCQEGGEGVFPALGTQKVLSSCCPAVVCLLGGHGVGCNHPYGAGNIPYNPLLEFLDLPMPVFKTLNHVLKCH